MQHLRNDNGLLLTDCESALPQARSNFLDPPELKGSAPSRFDGRSPWRCPSTVVRESRPAVLRQQPHGARRKRRECQQGAGFRRSLRALARYSCQAPDARIGVFAAICPAWEKGAFVPRCRRPPETRKAFPNAALAGLTGCRSNRHSSPGCLMRCGSGPGSSDSGMQGSAGQWRLRAAHTEIP